MVLEEGTSDTRVSENEPTEGLVTIKKTETLPLIYSVDDRPSWILSFILGVQHYLTMVGGIISVPFLLSGPLCIHEDDPTRGYLISTIFMVSGIATFLQSSLGVRLPIVQGSSFTYITCSLAILNLPQWKCPSPGDIYAMGHELRTEEWQTRMREIQGAIIAASAFEIIIGYCGLVGLVLRFITPLTIVPTITLVGLSLISHGTEMSAKNWYISVTTIILVAIFSQYLRHFTTPAPFYTLSKGWHIVKFKGFQLFPILMTTTIVYTICTILTWNDFLPKGDGGRTDTNRTRILENAVWFRIPYPFQWGWPTFSIASILAMFGAVIAGIVESVGDYYACARICGKPPPPIRAMNRGIGMEGIGCVLAGSMGIGTGVTSFSENIGAIGVTRVASRKVVQCGAIFMIFLSFCGKIGAAFATIPTPLIGGLLCIMFSVVTAVGLSNLQHVNMSSPRNLFVLGVSIFFGLAIPEWSKKNSMVRSGILSVDQLIEVLLSTHMFIGGFIGFVLDNTIPGTPEERGILAWKESTRKQDIVYDVRNDTYELPKIFGRIRQRLATLIRRPK